jgi:hypothetical protein
VSALRRHLPFLLLWLLVAAFLTYSGWDRVVTRVGWDPDDQLRLVQLRDFLNGQSWFDATQYRMNMPDGAPMHWSRLVELPLALVVLLLTPLLGSARAEMAAGIIIPMLCLGGIAFLLSQILEKIGGRIAGIAAFLLTLTSPALLIQLRPMRIDHHGWQIFCAAFSLSTLFCANVHRAGLALGAALAVWVHISLEGAPMTAAFFVLLGWRWIADREESVRLFWTLVSFAGASLLLFLGTQPSGFSASQYCDTVAPAHICAIMAAIAIMLPAARWSPAHRWLRLAIAGAAGIVAVAVLLWLAPMCREGAFGGLDPVVREYWYANITEGLPIWHQDLPTAITLMTPLTVAVGVWGIAWRTTNAEHRPMLGVLGFFLVYASILSLLVFRTVSVATLFSVPPVALCLAAIIRRYGAEPALHKRLMLVPAALLLLVPAMVGSAVADAFEPKPSKAESKRLSTAENCESFASIQALAKLPAGNIIAPFDVGPAILLTSKHKILASSHHRNAKGMRDQIDIFRLPPEQAKAIIDRRGIDYLAACPGEAELENYAQTNPTGLWAKIASGNAPDWLRYRGTFGKGIRVWTPYRDSAQ